MTSPLGSRSPLRCWWGQVDRFDRGWIIGCAVVLVLGLLGWPLYAALQPALQRYLQTVEFDGSTARTVATFSTHQVGWSLLCFTVASGLLVLVLSQLVRERRAKWWGLLFGSLLLLDLFRADQPWVVSWDYKQKYASNPILDFLQQKPYEHRIVELPRWFLQAFQVPPHMAQTEQLLQQLYSVEWIQHQFLYYNIQSLDVSQMPRMPDDLAAYNAKFMPQPPSDFARVARLWQLTNTRYLLGAAAFLNLLNEQLDSQQQRFRIAERFNILPKPGLARATRLEDLTAVSDTNGPFAVFEFTGALPRAKLYSNWQISTNEQDALEQIASQDFDPGKIVIVSQGVPGIPKRQNDNIFQSDATFLSYAPKDIVVQATPSVPSILLLNDRYSTDWQVFVDRKPATLLKCNYLMRGVYLEPGTRRVEFRFHLPVSFPLARLEIEPDTQAVSFVFHIPTAMPSLITLFAYGIGLILLIVLILPGRRTHR